MQPESLQRSPATGYRGRRTGFFAWNRALSAMLGGFRLEAMRRDAKPSPPVFLARRSTSQAVGTLNTPAPNWPVTLRALAERGRMPAFYSGPCPPKLLAGREKPANGVRRRPSDNYRSESNASRRQLQQLACKVNQRTANLGWRQCPGPI